MGIDIAYALLLAFAFWKGYQRGLIVALFSFVAVFIALAAAMKLSAVTAKWLMEEANLNNAWLPFFSFILVMVAMLLLIRLGANMLETAFKMMWVGWLNTLGGILLYALLSTITFSILLFYVEQIQLIPEETKSASICYPFLEAWGPAAMDGIARFIPLFKEMFSTLTEFFEKVAAKA